jgi:hypothetical protein
MLDKTNVAQSGHRSVEIGGKQGSTVRLKQNLAYDEKPRFESTVRNTTPPPPKPPKR